MTKMKNVMICLPPDLVVRVREQRLNISAICRDALIKELSGISASSDEEYTQSYTILENHENRIKALEDILKGDTPNQWLID